MREVIIGEHQFVIGNLEPKRAFHVMRRLAPLVGSLRDFLPYATGEKVFDGANLDDVAMLVEPIAMGLASMPEADANYVIDACLSVVQLRHPGGVMTPVQAGGGGGHLMYDWISMPMMMRLVYETVIANLAGFTTAGASAS